MKIYKTSILVFKDRDKYVTGEYRFRRGYSRNPRKMVRLWAEKEMRNLKRLVTAGINTPEPIEVRENVLVMGFVGDEEGWQVIHNCSPGSLIHSIRRASPRLKDATLPSDSVTELYAELVLIIRRVFHICKLVHADLSEYNILYHNGHLWIIDVSQSVEHDHPFAFDFLRSDIKNVEEFFGRLGVKCFGLRRCFEFVTKEKVADVEGESDEDALQRWLAVDAGKVPSETGKRPESEVISGIENLAISSSNQISSKSAKEPEDAAHEDAIFLRSFIPRTLNEVYDPERDVERLKRGDGLIYADTIGFVSTGTDPNGGPKPSEHQAPDTDEEDRDSETDDDESAERAEKISIEKTPRGHRHEDKDAKKVMDLSFFFSFFFESLHSLFIMTRTERRRLRRSKQRGVNIRCRKPRKSGSLRNQKVGERSTFEIPTIFAM